jgi:hypothetical protein
MLDAQCLRPTSSNGLFLLLHMKKETVLVSETLCLKAAQTVYNIGNNNHIYCYTSIVMSSDTLSYVEGASYSSPCSRVTSFQLRPK